MGLYNINCPACGKAFEWFSGLSTQLCHECQKQTPPDQPKGTSAREFWISPGVEAWQSDEVVMNPACVKPHHIHVIEKSAYLDVVKERDEARDFAFKENDFKCIATRDLSSALAELEISRSNNQKCLGKLIDKINHATKLELELEALKENRR